MAIFVFFNVLKNMFLDRWVFFNSFNICPYNSLRLVVKGYQINFCITTQTKSKNFRKISCQSKCLVFKILLIWMGKKNVREVVRHCCHHVVKDRNATQAEYGNSIFYLQTFRTVVIENHSWEGETRQNWDNINSTIPLTHD